MQAFFRPGFIIGALRYVYFNFHLGTTVRRGVHPVRQRTGRLQRIHAQERQVHALRRQEISH
jgi:hypothetical protein